MNGRRFKTQYDKPNDPPSFDCNVKIIVFKPDSKPNIHMSIPCGFDDLEIYRQEVLFGVHDHWINPKDGYWEYTYHQRLFDFEGVNQIEECIQKLIKFGQTRQAQAITWNPKEDNHCYDPACLQRIFFRIYEEDGYEYLEADVDMRSNDAFKASFMNMYAFVEIQKYVANEVSKRTGRDIKIGRYIHNANSFHIYGSYVNEFKDFLEKIIKIPEEQRYRSSEDLEYFFDLGRIKLFNNVQKQDVEMPIDHLLRLYNEISEDFKDTLDINSINRIKDFI
jgi:thymidylate synthase